MKVFFRKGWRGYSVRFCFGRIMWRCTNGSPNFQRELWISPTVDNDWNDDIPWRPLWPVVQYRAYRVSCLASVDELGRESGSFSIELRWLWFAVNVMAGKTMHTKEITR